MTGVFALSKIHPYGKDRLVSAFSQSCCGLATSGCKGPQTCDTIDDLQYNPSVVSVREKIAWIKD
jgi:hypothetical protein